MKRVPLWLVGLACLGSALVGAHFGRGNAAVAQAQIGKDGMKPGEQEPPVLSEYPFLPNRYGEAYIPSVAEWRALQFTALNSSTTRITQEFSRSQCICIATPKGLLLSLDLLPQPTWKHYVGGGKFDAPEKVVTPDLQRAIDATVRSLRGFFGEAKDKDIAIQLFVRNEPVGQWADGKLTLGPPKPAE